MVVVGDCTPVAVVTVPAATAPPLVIVAEASPVVETLMLVPPAYATPAEMTAPALRTMGHSMTSVPSALSATPIAIAIPDDIVALSLVSPPFAESATPSAVAIPSPISTSPMVFDSTYSLYSPPVAALTR